MKPSRSGVLRVRIRDEIIPFPDEGVDPASKTAPRIAPGELMRWLDEGREFFLLDTRNDYEVELGTFRGARTLELETFRDFPRVSRTIPESMKDRPVVLFCTGGIRCEKAAPFLQSEGFQEVYQLDGGILRYFEECGDSHFEGSCFVFDERVALTPGLEAVAVREKRKS